MRLGLAETHIVWENKELNKINLEKCVEEFSRAVSPYKETALLLFPEMSMTGFSMNTDITAEDNDESLVFAEYLSNKYKIALGIGWVKKQKMLCENHYSILAPCQGLISDYVKIHPFSYSGEDKLFKGGEKISVCKLDAFNIGTAICYDLRFPEIFQIMSKKAELIVVPANWPKKRSTHWNTLLCARAIENQCYVAGINCFGEIGGVNYSGDSGLYSPSGEKIIPDEVLSLKACEKGNMQHKLLIYKIENNVAKERAAFPMKKDRREALYKNL